MIQKYTRCEVCDTLALWPSDEKAPDQSAEVPVLTIGVLGGCRHCPASTRALGQQLMRRPGGIYGAELTRLMREHAEGLART